MFREDNKCYTNGKDSNRNVTTVKASFKNKILMNSVFPNKNKKSLKDMKIPMTWILKEHK